MHATPSGPTRGNWIWLASAAFSITVLAAVGLSYTGGHRCRPAAGAAGAAASPQTGAGSPGAASRAASRAAAAAASPGGSAGAGPAPSDPAPVASGLALFYDPGSAVGSCALGPFPPGGLYASLPPERYAGGAACGSYLRVHGPKGDVLAEVVDLCPGCAATTVNLSETAFDKIADPAPGSAMVTYQQAVDPRLPGPLVVHVIATTTPGLIAVQILNHGNPLGSVAIARESDLVRSGDASPSSPPTGPAGAWRPLSVRMDDVWVSTAGLSPGPFALRVSDDRGHQVVLRGLSLTPGATIRPGVWMYAPAAPAGRPPAASPRSSPPLAAAARC